jgi:hypothetical protein
MDNHALNALGHHVQQVYGWSQVHIVQVFQEWERFLHLRAEDDTLWPGSYIAAVWEIVLLIPTVYARHCRVRIGHVVSYPEEAGHEAFRVAGRARGQEAYVRRFGHEPPPWAFEEWDPDRSLW